MKILVAEVREKKGVTLMELARRSGVAISHIHNIENGKKVPTVTVLCKIAKALEVPCSELFSCDDG